MILKPSLLKFLKTGAIPLLLCSVAIRQIVLVHTAGLSPWHGGGFGMFASMDRDERRVITTKLVDCRDTQDFVLSKILADAPEVFNDAAYTHVSTFPTESQLQRLGQQVLSPATQNSVAARYAENREKDCSTELQLQPWRLIYQDGSIAYEPLAEQVEVQP